MPCVILGFRPLGSLIGDEGAGDEDGEGDENHEDSHDEKDDGDLIKDRKHRTVHIQL